jgi:hypothetical protein
VGFWKSPTRQQHVVQFQDTAVEQDLPLARCSVELNVLKVRSKVDLPQPDGLDEGGDLLRDVHVDVLQRMKAAVVKLA